MSTATENQPRTRWLIFWLVLGHSVVGLIGCAVARNTLLPGNPALVAAAFFGLMFAQTSLLGLWFSLGTGRWWARLTGVLVGLVSISTLFCLGVDEAEKEVILLIVCPGLMIAGLLAAGRCFGLGIRPLGVDTSHKTAAQFSIRHLMLLTLAVACLCAAAKWLHVEIGVFPGFALIASPFVVLGLVAVWAILATKHATLGIATVSLLAALLGFGLALVVSDAEVANLWITVTMTGTLVFGASLYVIRLCGFRVRWQPKGKVVFEV